MKTRLLPRVLDGLVFHASPEESDGQGGDCGKEKSLHKLGVAINEAEQL
jgi:hypothetical protein